jgi:peptidyl-prolyl cis-trans isomerase SurA
MGSLFAKVARVGRLWRPRVVTLLLLGTGALMLCPGPARGQMLADGIAAVVNDKVITYLQINEQVSETEKLLRQNLQGQELMDRLREAKLNVLKALIDRELIIQDFKNDKKGIIPDTFVNARIDDEIRERYGGDRMVFVKTLYERGETLAKFREEIEDNAIVQYMRTRNVSQSVLISPYQIEQYYQNNLRLFQQDEQVKISTIVLRKSQFPSTKTGPDGKEVTYDPQEEIAKEILYKLDTGAEFADLAKSYSEGSNKDDGGALGWVTETGKLAIRADLWPFIEKLQPGQHTDVISTSDGFYYIVQVEDRSKAKITPLEDVRKQIEDTIQSQESQLRQQQWLDSLRAKAYVKMFL